MKIETIIVVAAIYIVIGFFFERWLKKKFNIGKSEGRVNQLHVEIDTALTLAAILIVIVVTLIFENAKLPFSIVILFFIIQALFRTYMEWKHKRESKQYIISFFSVIYIVTGFVLLLMVV